MGYPIPPCINKKKRKFWRNSHLELWPSWALAERQCCLLCFRTERILLTVSSRSAQAYSGCAPRQQISKHYYCSRFGVKQSFSRAKRYIHQRVRIYFAICSKTLREYELLPITPDCIGARPPLSSANAQDENTACRQMNFTRLFLALAGYVYCKLRCVRFDSTVNQTFRMSA